MRALLSVLYFSAVAASVFWIYTSYKKANEPVQLTRKAPPGYGKAKSMAQVYAEDKRSWEEKANAAMTLAQKEAETEATAAAAAKVNPISGPVAPHAVTAQATPEIKAAKPEMKAAKPAAKEKLTQRVAKAAGELWAKLRGKKPTKVAKHKPKSGSKVWKLVKK